MKTLRRKYFLNLVKTLKAQIYQKQQYLEYIREYNRDCSVE